METYETVRHRIESVKNIEIRMFLKAAYLLGAQGYELTGLLDSPTGTLHRKPNIVYGPKGSDVSKVTIIVSVDFKVEVALFRIRSSGIKVVPVRIIALPIFDKYDPWNRELYAFFLSKGDDYVFQFNRQKVWSYITNQDPIFDGLTFLTRAYKYGDQLMCLSHPRLVKIHHLPILRSYELTDKYGFDLEERKLYYGSVMLKNGFSSLTGASAENQGWHKYIQKLLSKGQY
jgi:hypothetical protein